MGEQGIFERREQPAEARPVIPVLDYQGPQAEQGSKWALSWVELGCWGAIGIGLPILCFAYAARGYPAGPDWQSGRSGDLIRLIPDGRVAWPFFPLLGFAMMAMGALVARPRVVAGRFWVRLGLCGGIVLALQFAVIQAIAIAHTGSDSDDEVTLIALLYTLGAIAATIVALLVLHWVMWALMARARLRWWWDAGSAGAAALYLIIRYTGLMWLRFRLPSFEDLLTPCMLAPALAAGTYILASIYALWWSRPRRDRWRWWPAASWAGVYGGAWWLAVQRAMAVYQTLPTSEPNRCYVATAAARGHRSFVGGQQFRRLKMAEIVVMTLWPAGHRSIRRAYDRLGPSLARRIDNPYLADLAYLSLKPAEWAAMGLLTILHGRVARATEELRAA